MANKLKSKCSGISISERGKRNALFQDIGLRYITEHSKEISDYDTLEFAPSITEQIGRMVTKPIEAATIVKQAQIATNALNAGHTVKQVENYLRHGRTTGKWNESLLTATREAATAKPHPNIIEYLTIDDLRGISTYLDVLYECVTKETTVKKLKKLTRKQIEELHEDINNLNGRIAQTVLYTEAQEQLKGDSV